MKNPAEMRGFLLWANKSGRQRPNIGYGFFIMVHYAGVLNPPIDLDHVRKLIFRARAARETSKFAIERTKNRLQETDIQIERAGQPVK
jgi:hypothetical protein